MKRVMTSGRNPDMRLERENPSVSGKHISAMRRSKVPGWDRTNRQASSPSAAMSSVYPLAWKATEKSLRIIASSSTIRIVRHTYAASLLARIRAYRRAWKLAGGAHQIRETRIEPGIRFPYGRWRSASLQSGILKNPHNHFLDMGMHGFASPSGNNLFRHDFIVDAA